MRFVLKKEKTDTCVGARRRFRRREDGRDPSSKSGKEAARREEVATVRYSKKVRSKTGLSVQGALHLGKHQGTIRRWAPVAANGGEPSPKPKKVASKKSA